MNEKQKDSMPDFLESGDFLESINDQSYQLPESSIKYHNAYFAFIDMLGFKSLLDTEGENAPKLIFNIIKDAYLSQKSSYQSIQLKVLSDSILVWSVDDHPVLFWNLLNVVDLLRSSFLNKGILIRGGISLGKNFIHKDIIVSPALARAYKLEQEAKFPRILISKDAIAKGQEGMVLNGHAYGMLYNQRFRRCNQYLISTDFDGKQILRDFITGDGVFCLLSGLPLTHFPGDTPLRAIQIKKIKESGISILKETKEYIISARPQSSSVNSDVIEKHNYVSDKFNSVIKELSLKNEIGDIKRIEESMGTNENEDRKIYDKFCDEANTRIRENNQSINKILVTFLPLVIYFTFTFLKELNGAINNFILASLVFDVLTIILVFGSQYLGNLSIDKSIDHAHKYYIEGNDEAFDEENKYEKYRKLASVMIMVSFTLTLVLATKGLHREYQNYMERKMPKETKNKTTRVKLNESNGAPKMTKRNSNGSPKMTKKTTDTKSKDKK